MELMNTDIHMTTVINPDSRPFRVRLVVRGMNYGLDDCMTHYKDDPLVEFYDASHFYKDNGRGQFTGGRYYLSTLKQPPRSSALALHGGVPEWWLSQQNVADAIYWAEFLLRTVYAPQE